MPKRTTIATAIPYVNGTFHIGNILTDLAGDVTARYHRMRGEDVFFVAGTDENGLKILEAAKEAGEDPLDPKPPEPVLAIGLSPLGYVMDGKLVGGDAELKAQLEPIIKRRDDKKVFLSPELDVPNGRVVGAIEALQGCGASAVALVQVVDPQAGAAR